MCLSWLFVVPDAAVFHPKMIKETHQYLTLPLYPYAVVILGTFRQKLLRQHTFTIFQV